MSKKCFSSYSHDDIFKVKLCYMCYKEALNLFNALDQEYIDGRSSRVIITIVKCYNWFILNDNFD